MTRVAVIVFPGSNCDEDAVYALERAGATAKKVWHSDTSLGDVDAVIIPGGFSYGDYLRCGAIAKFSPIMREVSRFATEGRPVLGICNGFQILVEAGLLPGALLRNRDLSFICKTVALRLETTQTPFTRTGIKEKTYHLPIAHMDGNYFIDEDGLKSLHDNDQVVFRYIDKDGQANITGNPNGSLDNIAGICNTARNVVGLMPHPERVVEALLGGEDGQFMFRSMMM